MQSLSAEGCQGVAGLWGEQARLGPESGAVCGVPEDWMPQMRQMHADLVGAPGLQGAGEQAGGRAAGVRGGGRAPGVLARGGVNRSSTCQWVTAARPLLRTACLSRACGWRPSGASIVPFGVPGAPQTTAR